MSTLTIGLPDPIRLKIVNVLNATPNCIKLENALTTASFAKLSKQQCSRTCKNYCHNNYTLHWVIKMRGEHFSNDSNVNRKRHIMDLIRGVVDKDGKFTIFQADRGPICRNIFVAVLSKYLLVINFTSQIIRFRYALDEGV